MLDVENARATATLSVAFLKGRISLLFYRVAMENMASKEEALLCSAGVSWGVSECKRKQLICDMEKASCFMRAGDYYAQYDYLK
jgi:hypothetical protein